MTRGVKRKVNVIVETAQAEKLNSRSTQGLYAFSAYTKSLELFDMVVEDLQILTGKYEVTKIVAQ